MPRRAEALRAHDHVSRINGENFGRASRRLRRPRHVGQRASRWPRRATSGPSTSRSRSTRPIQYKFFVNGTTWKIDPAQPTITDADATRTTRSPARRASRRSAKRRASCRPASSTGATPSSTSSSSTASSTATRANDCNVAASAASSGPIANYQGGDWAGVTQKINERLLHRPRRQHALDHGAVQEPAASRASASAATTTSTPATTATGRSSTTATRRRSIGVVLRDVRRSQDARRRRAREGPQGALRLRDGARARVVRRLRSAQRLVLAEQQERLARLHLRRRYCKWETDPRALLVHRLPPALELHERRRARRTRSRNAVAWIKQTRTLGHRRRRLPCRRHQARRHLVAHGAAREDQDATSSRTQTPPQRFYMVGETYDFGNRDLIKQYVDPATKLDGQFDFPLRAAHRRVDVIMRTQNMSDLAAFMNSNDYFYGASAVMSTFIGNHDLPRVIHLAANNRLWGDEPGRRRQGPRVAEPARRRRRARRLRAPRERVRRALHEPRRAARLLRRRDRPARRRRSRQPPLHAVVRRSARTRRCLKDRIEEARRHPQQASRAPPRHAHDDRVERRHLGVQPHRRPATPSTSRSTAATAPKDVSGLPSGALTELVTGADGERPERSRSRRVRRASSSRSTNRRLRYARAHMARSSFTLHRALIALVAANGAARGRHARPPSSRSRSRRRPPRRVRVGGGARRREPTTAQAVRDPQLVHRGRDGRVRRGPEGPGAGTTDHRAELVDRGPRDADGNQTVWLLDDKGEPLVKVHITRGMKRSRSAGAAARSTRAEPQSTCDAMSLGRCREVTEHCAAVHVPTIAPRLARRNDHDRACVGHGCAMPGHAVRVRPIAKRSRDTKRGRESTCGVSARRERVLGTADDEERRTRIEAYGKLDGPRESGTLTFSRAFFAQSF